MADAQSVENTEDYQSEYTGNRQEPSDPARRTISFDALDSVCTI